MKRQLNVLIFMISLFCAIPSTAHAAPVTMPDGTVFDGEYYAENNPDVVSLLGNDTNVLYTHYKAFGINEGRKPSANNLSNINIGLNNSTYDIVVPEYGLTFTFPITGGTQYYNTGNPYAFDIADAITRAAFEVDLQFLDAKGVIPDPSIFNFYPFYVDFPSGQPPYVVYAQDIETFMLKSDEGLQIIKSPATYMDCVTMRDGMIEIKRGDMTEDVLVYLFPTIKYVNDEYGVWDYNGNNGTLIPLSAAREGIKSGKYILEDVGRTMFNGYNYKILERQFSHIYVAK